MLAWGHDGGRWTGGRRPSRERRRGRAWDEGCIENDMAGSEGVVRKQFFFFASISSVKVTPAQRALCWELIFLYFLGGVTPEIKEKSICISHVCSNQVSHI